MGSFQPSAGQQHLAQGAVPQPGHHPVAVAAGDLQALGRDQFSSCGDGELGLPAGEPLVQGDEHLLAQGVVVEGLGHVDDQVAAGLEDADVVAQQGRRCRGNAPAGPGGRPRRRCRRRKGEPRASPQTVATVDAGRVGGLDGQFQGAGHVVQGQHLGARPWPGSRRRGRCPPPLRGCASRPGRRHRLVDASDLPHHAPVGAVDVVQFQAVGLFPELLPVCGGGFSHVVSLSPVRFLAGRPVGDRPGWRPCPGRR